MWLRKRLDTDMPILHHPSLLVVQSDGSTPRRVWWRWAAQRLGPHIDLLRQAFGRVLECCHVQKGMASTSVTSSSKSTGGELLTMVESISASPIPTKGSSNSWARTEGSRTRGVDPVIMLGTGDGKPDRPRVFSLVITSSRWAASSWVRLMITFVVEERDTSPFHIRRRARRQSSTAVMAGTSMGHVLAGACKVGQCASVRSLLCERLLQVNASMSLPSYRWRMSTCTW